MDIVGAVEAITNCDLGFRLRRRSREEYQDGSCGCRPGAGELPEHVIRVLRPFDYNKMFQPKTLKNTVVFSD